MEEKHMKKRLIIHDLTDEAFAQLKIDLENTSVIKADGKYAPCKGCFGCWAKTPGKCVLKDRLQYIGAMIAESDEVILISKNCYGGLSSEVKNVQDRGIAMSLPFFTFREGRIHHMHRYKKYQTNLIVYLYGDMTPLEKQTAKKLVEANRINGAYKSAKLITVEKLALLKEVVA